jgi:hypothetical protein
MGALFSFLGGSVFRMIWGEVSHYITAKQEQKNEMERLRLQGDLDKEKHSRELESISIQASLGIKTIRVQSEADMAKVDADAFLEAVKAVGKPTGIAFIDIWNGMIRPWLATMSTIMVMIQFVQHGFIMTDWDAELVGAILGIYVADRSLKSRGK